MRLEQGDASFIFSTIELPDIFFTEYLSQSSGDQIKVYLYILFLSKYGKEIRLNDLSKQLTFPPCHRYNTGITSNATRRDMP